MKTTILVLALIFSFSTLAKEVPAYFEAGYMPKEKLVTALEQSGFKILGSHQVKNQEAYETFFITTDKLIQAASKDKRGFASHMRILLNSKDKTILISNPHYFLQAFMQKDYNVVMANEIYQSFSGVFKTLNGTKDILEEKELAGYHFMFGMPYYDEFVKVAKGDNNTLISKIKKKGNIVFEQKLNHNSTLLGIGLSDEIENFVDTLDQWNKSILLPYTVLIENNHAYILHAKYYLAISLPLLGMGQFMTISDIPAKIEDEVEKLFK